MTKAQINKAFLAATDQETKNLILDNIAAHYGITREQVIEEVTDEEAEHLLDYVTGRERDACYVVMKSRGFI